MLRWTLGILFCLVIAAIAYYAGRLSTLEQVLVAKRDMRLRASVTQSDFSHEYRKNVPATAIRDFSAIRGMSLSLPLSKGDIVRYSDLNKFSTLGFGDMPDGHSVVNVKLDPNTDPLIYHLLMRGDRVSLVSANDPTLLTTNSEIQIAVVSSKLGLVGLLVDDATARAIQKLNNFSVFRLAPP